MKPYKTLFVATALLSVPVLAQQPMDHSKMDHGKMNMQAMMAGNPYGQAEMDMHEKMMAAKRGDVSEIWTRKMIEHHRGGIAMSRVALREAKDAETRRMAQKTIDAQTKEVAELQAWLRKHGKAAQ